jgi:hypothetical protein
MHRWMVTSAVLILGLAVATPPAASPYTSDMGQSDDRMEAARRFAVNLFVGSFTVVNNVLPRVEPVTDVLLSVSPPDDDADSADMQFLPRVEDYDNWLREAWLP